MSKPLTKAQIQLKKCRRLKDKGLGQMLLYRFLNHYGYDKGVDRYIQDYHRVEVLWQHGITDLDQISQLTRLAKRVVHQYGDLLPEKVRKRLTGNPMTRDS